MQTMADLGVTGFLELAPGRHPRRPGQAGDCPASRSSPSRPPTTSTAARDLVARHGGANPVSDMPTWRLLVAPAKGTFRRSSSADLLVPGATVGVVVTLRDEQEVTAPHRRPRRRVARRGRRPGRAGPAPRTPAPRGGARVTGAPAFTMGQGAPFARMLGVGGYRPARVVPNDDPQIQARGSIVEVEHPRLGRIPIADVPLRFTDRGLDPPLRVAMLGEHNERVFREILGYSAEELAAFQRAGVVA